MISILLFFPAKNKKGDDGLKNVKWIIDIIHHAVQANRASEAISDTEYIA